VLAFNPSLSNSDTPLSNSSCPVRKLTFSSPTMVTNSTNDDGNYVIKIVFNEPWHCPLGNMFIRADRVNVGGRLVDKVRVLKPIFDVQDYKDKHYRARLTPNGDGIVFTDPTVPAFLRERDNCDHISNLVDKTKDANGNFIGDYDEKTKECYEASATDMLDDDYKHVETIFRFPTGITCNNDFFNADSQGNNPTDVCELKMRLKVDEKEIGRRVQTDQNGNQVDVVPVNTYHFFLVFEMAVDDANSTGRRTLQATKQYDDVNSAFGNLGISLG
jgi:hypothetical protein